MLVRIGKCYLMFVTDIFITNTWIKIYRRNNLVYKGNFLNCFYLITVPHPFKISVYLIAVHIQ